MKPEKQHLIRDLLVEDSNREATLLAGAGILRRRRQWSAVVRGGAVLALGVVIAGLLLRREALQPAQVVSVPAPVVPATTVHEMNDDELLALFPGTPVALASLPDGKKRLIFPRAGDEGKFVTKL